KAGSEWSQEHIRCRIARQGPGGEAVIMSARTPEAEPLLTPAEVATMFRVDPKTVTRWAKAGKLTSIRTLGGHRRYRETEVRALVGGTARHGWEDRGAAAGRPKVGGGGVPGRP